MTHDSNSTRARSSRASDPCFWSAAQMHAAFRAKRFSPAEAVDACAGQIDQLESTLAAFLAVDLDHARDTAALIDVSAEPAKNLAGIPYSLKDNIDVKNWRTTCHSSARRDVVADKDSDVASALRDAAAILIGKNSLHELATGGPSLDLPWPPARNPWDSARHPGGSSSGSAVAVAAGMAYFALGTDTGGSVRHPASACGIYGFKPTFEAISTTGVVPLSGSCDHVGVLCRSAHDLPLTMGAIAARSADRQAYQALALTTPKASLRGAVVGVIDSFSSGIDAHPEMTKALNAMIASLHKAGAIIKRVDAPPLARFIACSRSVVYTEAYAYHGEAIDAHPTAYGQRTLDRIGKGRLVTVREYVLAKDEQRLLTQQLDTALRDVDVCLSLSSFVFPCPIDDQALIRDTYDLQARVPLSLTGLPAASVPVGLSAQGLPVGLQFGAAAGRDISLVSFLQALEDAGLCGYAPPPA